MAVVKLTISSSSYDQETTDKIYGPDGDKSVDGYDFGEVETGSPSARRWYFVRHDGAEKIYNAGLYLRPFGNSWGGYCPDYPDSRFPYNPNIFMNGGVDDNRVPKTSTEDYNLLRESADNNPDMGVRLYLDRSNPDTKTDGLGYNNKGLNFSPVPLPSTALDFSNCSSLDKIDGVIYPRPIDDSDDGKCGDEALIGIDVQLPEEIEGSGYVQFSVGIKYRYTE